MSNVISWEDRVKLRREMEEKMRKFRETAVTIHTTTRGSNDTEKHKTVK